MENAKIRVLIVDDSAVVRKMLAEIIGRDPQIEVVGTAVDPYMARDQILALKPDVVTLDLEMPRMDGITFLKILMQHHPVRIVVMSSLTANGSVKALEALTAGALEVMSKPENPAALAVMGDQLILKIKAAAMAQAKPTRGVTQVAPVRSLYNPQQLILMGASTGGTDALQKVLKHLPQQIPGICIVQHIPAFFSKAFADRLNSLCKIEVREAVDGDHVKPGLALLAPGGRHMTLRWQLTHYVVTLKDGPVVWHQRPSVDVLFSSAANYNASGMISVLLTGMGRDGAVGMARLKEAGATNFAQSEEDCVVYGMPRSAIEMGVVDEVLTLDAMPDAILSRANVIRRNLQH